MIRSVTFKVCLYCIEWYNYGRLLPLEAKDNFAVAIPAGLCAPGHQSRKDCIETEYGNKAEVNNNNNNRNETT